MHFLSGSSLCMAADTWQHRQVYAGASEALERQTGDSEGEIEDEDKEGEDEPREDRSETFVWEGKEQFMRLFYQQFMPQIIAPLTDTDNGMWKSIPPPPCRADRLQMPEVRTWCGVLGRRLLTC